MKAVNKWISIFILIAITFLQSQNANDAVSIVQDEMGFGARALGMGGAYVGLANDYSAIYWNPAGLTALRKSEFFGEMSHMNFNNAASFSSQLTDQSQNFTRLHSLGLALPLPTRRGSLVLALGYNRVKDFDKTLLFSGFNSRSNGLGFELEDNEGNALFYPFDRDVYQTEQVNDEGGLQQWSLAAAVALSPNFDVGVTINIWNGKDDYQFTFLQEDRDDVYNIFPGDYDSYQLNQTLQTKYSALGVKLGGMFKVVSGLQLGGAIGFPVTFTVNEVFTANDELVFDDGFVDEAELENGEFEYKVKTPIYFDGGISVSNRLITLAGSFRYRDWTQTKFKVPDDFIDNPDFADLLEENKFIKRDFRPTLQYNLGGEILLEGLKTKLRGGYAVYPSPFRNATSEMDKKFITAGLGFLVDRFVSLDIAYLRGNWKQESEDIYTPGGTLEDIKVNKILVGISYRF